MCLACAFFIFKRYLCLKNEKLLKEKHFLLQENKTKLQEWHNKRKKLTFETFAFLHNYLEQIR